MVFIHLTGIFIYTTIYFQFSILSTDLFVCFYVIPYSLNYLEDIVPSEISKTIIATLPNITLFSFLFHTFFWISLGIFSSI